MARYDAALARWPVPVATRVVATRSGNTNVISWGDADRPPLVLLHGPRHQSRAAQGDVRKCVILRSEMGGPRTLTISLPPQLAREVDRVARAERRSRSELLREAFRQYVARLKRWERIFAAGRDAARRARMSEADVLSAVKERRRARTR